ncbi:MAG TPA: glycosyltransferase family 9 protein [Longimicrobiales bacterium]|nr:glycosyltransferase family 9 protein [Longimicrobiales bacterium]
MSEPRTLKLPAPPREVCIVMMSAIGDAVHVLPVANALKRGWPRCRITWVIQPAAHKLVENHPAIDDFIIFRRQRGIAGWRSLADARRQLEGRRFDLVLALQVYFKAGVLTAMIDAPIKLGFDRARARDLNWLFTTHRLPAHPVQHVQDQYFEFVRYLGLDPRPVEWGIDITDEERRRQREFFAPLKRPVVAIVMGTSKPEKNWMAERYTRLIDTIQRDMGLTAVLVGGPSAIEKEITDATLYRCSTVPVNALGDDLRRLVWILDGADIVISPDTGPLHIARALERPVIGLYGYTNPKRLGPYAKYQDLIVDGYAKHPDDVYPASMEYRADGMKRVQAHSVIEKVGYALRTYVRKP